MKEDMYAIFHWLHKAAYSYLKYSKKVNQVGK